MTRLIETGAVDWTPETDSQLNPMQMVDRQDENVTLLSYDEQIAADRQAAAARPANVLPGFTAAEHAGHILRPVQFRPNDGGEA